MSSEVNISVFYRKIYVDVSDLPFQGKMSLNKHLRSIMHNLLQEGSLAFDGEMLRLELFLGLLPGLHI